MPPSFPTYSCNSLGEFAPINSAVTRWPLKYPLGSRPVVSARLATFRCAHAPKGFCLWARPFPWADSAQARRSSRFLSLHHLPALAHSSRQFSFSGPNLARWAHAPLQVGGSRLLLPASPLGRLPQKRGERGPAGDL